MIINEKIIEEIRKENRRQRKVDILKLVVLVSAYSVFFFYGLKFAGYI